MDYPRYQAGECLYVDKKGNCVNPSIFPGIAFLVATIFHLADAFSSSVYTDVCQQYDNVTLAARMEASKLGIPVIKLHGE
jgi:hypothetical protein